MKTYLARVEMEILKYYVNNGQSNMVLPMLGNNENNKIMQ